MAKPEAASVCPGEAVMSAMRPIPGGGETYPFAPATFMAAPCPAGPGSNDRLACRRGSVIADACGRLFEVCMIVYMNEYSREGGCSDGFEWFARAKEAKDAAKAAVDRGAEEPKQVAALPDNQLWRHN